jgi:energy-coupling factor transport system ATP-binding protein
MPIIDFENARFSYDGKRDALDGVTIAIEAGSFVCVLGGNGSGKSTLAKHVNALLAPDAGCVRVLDCDTSEPDNVFFVRSNAGMVFQNPDDQIVASVIENDVAFGPENLGVPADELRDRVEAALAQVGLQGFEKKQTETLSGGQKQRVAVAGVLAMEPQILVLDEASAMLDPRGRTGLLRVCRELNDKGLTIVLITHFMEEAALADRVIVLDRGQIALDGTPEEVFLQAERLAALALDIPFATRLSQELRQRGVSIGMHADEASLEEELVSLLEGARETPPSLVARKPHDIDTSAREAEPPAGETSPHLIEFKNVSFTYEPRSQKQHRESSVAPSGKQADWGRAPSEYWALHDLSFSVRAGEFFGIAGHTGSGKSTLIQLANGLLKPTTGSVFANGRSLSDKSVATEARRDIGVVFQYPEHQLFAATVFDDVAFGPRNLGYSTAQIEEGYRRAMELVHLDPDGLRDRSPFSLSGGQQRRVAFAGVLAMKPSALVLDEPVAGLDPKSKRQFLELLTELRRDHGMTIVIVSHNMDDLAELCDRILVLNEGKLFALGEPALIFSDESALKAVGLGVPHTAHMVNRLAASGISLPIGAMPSIEDLAESIAETLAARHLER